MSLEALVRAHLGELVLDAGLEIATGESVVLLGPNGAGKTTLLRALAGLVPLDDGKVVLDGELLEDPAQGWRMPAEQRAVGVVFQDYLLFPHLSLVENVAFGLRARGMKRAEAQTRAGSWLARVGLGHRGAERPNALSGGQAQRVALVRALATKPRLLLLDEPLAALDAGARPALRRDLKRHLSSFVGTRLIVTHDPLEALLLGDRVVEAEDPGVVVSEVGAALTVACLHLAGANAVDQPAAQHLHRARPPTGERGTGLAARRRSGVGVGVGRPRARGSSCDR